VKKAEVDSGKRAGVPTDMVEKLKDHHDRDCNARERNGATVFKTGHSISDRPAHLNQVSQLARSWDFASSRLATRSSSGGLPRMPLRARNQHRRSGPPRNLIDTANPPLAAEDVVVLPVPVDRGVEVGGSKGESHTGVFISFSTPLNNKLCPRDYLWSQPDGCAVPSNADKYRKQAEECQQEAKRTRSRIAKRRWLRIADFYRKLAVQADKKLRPPRKPSTHCGP
jgi:hypothetical protein